MNSSCTEFSCLSRDVTTIFTIRSCLSENLLFNAAIALSYGNCVSLKVKLGASEKRLSVMCSSIIFRCSVRVGQQPNTVVPARMVTKILISIVDLYFLQPQAL